MAYIGKEPIVGNFQVCDAISVVNGQAAYTMQVSSTNVTPESANHMLVSLNGILQKPGSSFTISGSTITFASALSTGDVIDFIMLLGNVLDLGVPSDATVTQAKTNFVSTSSAAGLQIKGDGTTDGTLQLNCSQNSHGIKLKSPAHSTSSSYTLTFPGTDPSADKFLKTDGSGNLSFADAGGGKVLQVVSTVKTDVFETSSTSYVAVTGLSATITPSATSSKVLVHVVISMGTGSYTAHYTLRRGTSTDLLIGDAASNRTRVTAVPNPGDTDTTRKLDSIPTVFLDSPNTTSATTYQPYIKIRQSGHTIYVNRNSNDNDAASYDPRVTSTITLMEISA